MSPAEGGPSQLFREVRDATAALTTALGAVLLTFAGPLAFVAFLAATLVSMFTFWLQLTSSHRQLRIHPGGAARGAVLASLGRSAIRATALAATYSLNPSLLPWVALGLFVAPASLAARQLISGTRGVQQYPR